MLSRCSWKRWKLKKARERIRDFLAPLELLSFDSAAVFLFAQIKDALLIKGKPSGIMDLLIAAVAQANECTVVTNNIKHFQAIPHLAVENWS